MIKAKKENGNVMIAKQNKQGDKEMMTGMRRQAYKFKAHDTFLAKHVYTSKGPKPSVEMVIKAIRKKKGFNIAHEAQWVGNGLIYRQR